MALKEDPSRFLATVQIGVTVIASMASVIGGAAAVRFLEPIVAHGAARRRCSTGRSPWPWRSPSC